MTTPTKGRVPVKPGLYSLPSESEPGHLIGTRCGACGEHFHPQRRICPICFSRDTSPVALGSRGTIFTYTIARSTWPGMPLKAPFVSALISLPEGAQVFSLVTGVDFDAAQIGMEVELYFWKVFEDQNGNEVTAYAFKPIGK
jgi:uncharacterized OB-fold protein